MPPWIELPASLLEQPEYDDLVCCDYCNKMLLQGDSVFTYVSTYGKRGAEFCSPECATEYFLKHELEEGVIV